MTKHAGFLLTVASFMCRLAAAAESANAPAHYDPATWRGFEFRTRRELETFSDVQRFGPSCWAQGERTLPRLYVADIVLPFMLAGIVSLLSSIRREHRD